MTSPLEQAERDLQKAMRAVAEDKEIAGLMGINVDRAIVTTFALGAAAGKLLFAADDGVAQL